jgi:hypothetical protein
LTWAPWPCSGYSAQSLCVAQVQALLLLGLMLIPAAPSLGLDPWLVVVTLLATSAVWFFPSQTPGYPLAYSAAEGRLFTHTQARRAALGYVGVVLVSLGLSVPYWHLLGLL